MLTILTTFSDFSVRNDQKDTVLTDFDRKVVRRRHPLRRNQIRN